MLQRGRAWILGYALLATACAGNDEDELGSTEIDGGGEPHSDGAVEEHDGSLDPGDMQANGDGGQGDGGQGDGDHDSGTQPMDSGAPDDAGTSDAGDDASAPQSKFSLRVVTERLPVQAMRVIFHKPDGSTLSADNLTSDQGYVFADEAPAAVTVVDDRTLEANGFVRLVTYLETESGDALTLRVPDVDDYSLDQRGYVLNFPAGLNGTTTRFRSAFGLGVSEETLEPDDLGSGVTFHVSAGDMRAQNALLLEGEDVDGQFTQYVYAKDLAAAGVDDPVAVSLQISDDHGYDVGVDHVPLDTYYPVMDLSMLASGISFEAREDAYPDGLPDILAGEVRTFRINEKFADSLDVYAHLERYSGAAGYFDQIDRVATPLAEDADPQYAHTVDFSGFAAIADYQVNEMDGVVTVSWSFADDIALPGADAQFVTFAWYLNDGPFAEWTVVIPPGVTSFSFPQVEDAVLGVVAPDQDLLQVLSAYDDSTIDSYAAYKQGVVDFTSEGGGRQLMYSSLPLYFAPRGATGSVRVVSSLPNNF